MKTLFLFFEIPDDHFFFELPGDYSHLDKVFINWSEDMEKIEELSKLVYDDNGEHIVKKSKIPTKDWTHFVTCGIHL